MDEKHAQVMFDYHQATKHSFHRFASSLGYLDWANQPNPFRFYEGTKRVRLPEAIGNAFIPYIELYQFIEITSFLEITHIHNFGVSFGLFSETVPSLMGV